MDSPQTRRSPRGGASFEVDQQIGFARQLYGDAERIARAGHLKRGMSHDMADLLVTLTKISDMPREERHTTPAGRALWTKYMAYCAMVDTDFEAFARNKAFDEFRGELKRLAALVQEPGVTG